MKKIFSVLLLLFMLFAVGCSSNIDITATFFPQGTLNPETGYKQWSTNDQSIIVTYPHTWFANTASDSYAIVQLFTPYGDATPGYREYIVFGAMEPQEGDTAQSVADDSWNDMKKMFPELELFKAEARTVSGYEMQYRYFGGHINDEIVGPEGDYCWQQYSFMASGLSYSITFSCTKEAESVYGPDFEWILNELFLAV